MLDSMALHVAELFSIVGVILVLRKLDIISKALSQSILLFKDQIIEIGEQLDRIELDQIRAKNKQHQE
jgi:hypothetical protein